MRVTIRRTPVLLLAALAAACASHPAPPPAPASSATVADAAVPAVAAHAGTVFAFRYAPTASPDEAPLAIQRMHVEMHQVFGLDVSDPGALARLGADPNRPKIGRAH